MAVSLASSLTGSRTGVSSFTPAQISLINQAGLDPSVALPSGVMTRRPSSCCSFAVHPFQGEFGTIAIGIFDGMVGRETEITYLLPDLHLRYDLAHLV